MKVMNCKECSLLIRCRLATALLMVGTGGAAMLAGGCQTPAATTQPAGPGELESAAAQEFAPLAPPVNYDESKAEMALGEIPDDPPSPSSEQEYEPPQLPRQALRRMEEARRLFAEQRFSETIREVEQALRYNANIREAHRMLAVACLMSGDETRARHSATKALELDPDDVISHYVLGRLSEKAGHPGEAIRTYRSALKCTTTEESATYRTLIHYYLGSMLYEEGYYSSAAEQLGAFEEGVSGLDETANGNAELETLMNTRRGMAALLQGRAYGYLGAYDKAAEALQRAAGQSPKDLDLRAEAIRMLVRADRTREAANAAASLVDDSGGSKDAVRLLLAVHQYTGHPERGLEAIRTILEKQPDRSELWLVYADGLIAEGEDEQAAGALNELVARFPDLQEARWKLIALQRRRGKWAEWLNALSQELARQAGAYEQAAGELLEVSVDTQSRILEEAASADPDAKWYVALPVNTLPRAAQLYLLGRLCDALDRTSEAEGYFEDALDQNVAFYPAAIGAVSMYIRRAQWQSGIKAVERAREILEEPTPQLERVLAQCYDGLDMMDEATTHYRQALELLPEDTTTLLLLGRLYERRGDQRGARTQYDEALEIDRENLQVREALVRLLVQSANLLQHDRLERQIVRHVQEMLRIAPESPETRRCMAMLKASAGIQQYVDALKLLIEKWPEETQNYEDLARVYFETRRFDEARETLQTLLDHDPYDAEAHFILAMTYKRLLDYDSADQQFRRMLEIHPNRESWLAQHGELLILMLAYDRAIETYSHLLDLEIPQANSIEYGTELMRAYRRAGRFDEARELVNRWMEDAEETFIPLYRWYLLAADLKEGRIDRYLERCEKWLSDAPDDLRVRGWYLGVTNYVSLSKEDDQESGLFEIPLPLPRNYFSEPCGLLGAERWDDAVTLAMRWYAEHPNRSRYAHWLIETLVATKRHEEAAEWGRFLLESTENYQDRLTAMEYLRGIYLRQNEFETAITTVKDMLAEATKARANESDQKDNFLLNYYWSRWQRALAGIYTQIKQYDNAVAYLQRLLEEADDLELTDMYKAELLRWMAFTYQEQDRLQDAEQHLRVALKLTPVDPGINNDLGYTLADAGRKLTEAEALIRLAVSEEPDQAAYMDSLGWVLYKKEEFEQARVWLERAAGMPEGRDPVIFDHLGDTWWRLDQKESAIAQWEHSLELQERKAEEGGDPVDAELTERVTAKIMAARQGGEPDVAEIGAKDATETQAAREE